MSWAGDAQRQGAGHVDVHSCLGKPRSAQLLKWDWGICVGTQSMIPLSQRVQLPATVSRTCRPCVLRCTLEGISTGSRICRKPSGKVVTELGLSIQFAEGFGSGLERTSRCADLQKQKTWRLVLWHRPPISALEAEAGGWPQTLGQIRLSNKDPVSKTLVRWHIAIILVLERWRQEDHMVKTSLTAKRIHGQPRMPVSKGEEGELTAFSCYRCFKTARHCGAHIIPALWRSRWRTGRSLGPAWNAESESSLDLCQKTMAWESSLLTEHLASMEGTWVPSPALQRPEHPQENPRNTSLSSSALHQYQGKVKATWLGVLGKGIQHLWISAPCPRKQGSKHCP